MSLIKKPSLIEILKIYGYVFKLNLQKQKRDYNLIDQQYNSGVWNSKPWEETDFESAYGNYARSESENHELVMCYEGNMVKAKWHDFAKECISEFLTFFKMLKICFFSKTKIVEKAVYFISRIATVTFPGWFLV